MIEPNFNGDVSVLNDNFAIIYDFESLNRSFQENNRSIVLKVDGMASFSTSTDDHLPTVRNVRTYLEDAGHYLVSADTYLTLKDHESVFLIRDQGSPHSKGFITNPGGMTDSDPLRCCLRELNEEILLLRKHPLDRNCLQVALIHYNGSSEMTADQKEAQVQGKMKNCGPNAARMFAAHEIDPNTIKVEVVKIRAELDSRFKDHMKKVTFNSRSLDVSEECFVPIWQDEANTLVCNLPLIADISRSSGWFAVDGEAYDREALIGTAKDIIATRNPPAASWTSHLTEIAEGVKFRSEGDKAFKLLSPAQVQRRESKKASLLRMPAL